MVEKLPLAEHVDLLSRLHRPRERRTHRDEILFSVVHEVSELWLQLAGNELEDAVAHVEAGELGAAVRLVRRANGSIEETIDALDMLEHLSPYEYQFLRPALEGSGFDLPGFKVARQAALSLGRAFDDALAVRGVSMLELYRGSREMEDLYQLAEQLLTLDHRLMRWRSHHIKLIERVVGGDAVGTAGTSVAALLRLTDKRQYPALWAVRNDLTAMAPLSPSNGQATESFLEHGGARLRALAEAMGFDEATTNRFFGVFEALTSPWGPEPVGDKPFWASDLSDDGTPYEFSYAIEPGRRELRVLAEARPDTPDAAGQWAAGMRLSDQLEQRYGVCLDRARAVQDLFVPTWDGARFGVWHSSMIRNGELPRFKLYFNPRAHGPDQAESTVRAALERLEVPWPALDRLQLGDKDQIVYLSLDLSQDPSARIKLYVAHRDADLDRIESAARHAPSAVPGEAEIFCRTLAMHGGPYDARPVLTCYVFLARYETPIAATVHFPVRSYVRNDQEVADRIRFLMTPEDWQVYLRVIDAFRQRHLEAGVGMHTYASFRRQDGDYRLTLYLATEAYHVGTAS